MKKYFSDKRKSELREWQKVVVANILRENDGKPIKFTHLLDRFRSEAQAFDEVELQKNEITANELRRILLELIADQIIEPELKDFYSLRIKLPSPMEKTYAINTAVYDLIGRNEFIYSAEDVATQLSEKFGVGVKHLATHIGLLVQGGALSKNDNNRLGFPKQEPT